MRIEQIRQIRSFGPFIPPFLSAIDPILTLTLARARIPSGDLFQIQKERAKVEAEPD